MILSELGILSFSILISSKASKISCPNEARERVLIIFSFEKLRSKLT